MSEKEGSEPEQDYEEPEPKLEPKDIEDTNKAGNKVEAEVVVEEEKEKARLRASIEAHLKKIEAGIFLPVVENEDGGYGTDESDDSTRLRLLGYAEEILGQLLRGERGNLSADDLKRIDQALSSFVTEELSDQERKRHTNIDGTRLAKFTIGDRNQTLVNGPNRDRIGGLESIGAPPRLS